MRISFRFSYSENIFVVFYLSFYFNLAQDTTARDTSFGTLKLEKCEFMEESTWGSTLAMGGGPQRPLRPNP